MTKKMKNNNPRNNTMKKNRSLVGTLPNLKNDSSEIKMSKKGLRKILKSLFSDMGLEENEILRMLKDLGKDEQSVQNLTKFINKTKKELFIFHPLKALKNQACNVVKYSFFNDLWPYELIL